MASHITLKSANIAVQANIIPLKQLHMTDHLPLDYFHLDTEYQLLS